MNYIKPIIQIVKPWLPMVIIISVLHFTGQLGTVVSLGQTAVLKSGILNADAETEIEQLEDFDFGFSAYSLTGEPLNMDSLQHKVIFLNIWATWCGPCRVEMPTIEALYNSVDKTDIAFVMLAVDRVDQDRRVKQYIESSGFTFPVYILQGEPTSQIKVPTLPSTFIISKKGKVLSMESGMRNYDTNKFRKFLLKEASR